MDIDPAQPLLPNQLPRPHVPFVSLFIKVLPVWLSLFVSCLFQGLLWMQTKQQEPDYDYVPNMISFLGSSLMCIAMLISARLENYRRSTLLLALAEGVRAVLYIFEFQWAGIDAMKWEEPVQWAVIVTANSLHTFGVLCASNEILVKAEMKQRNEKSPVPTSWWVGLIISTLATIGFAVVVAIFTEQGKQGHGAYSGAWFNILYLIADGMMIGYLWVVTFTFISDIRSRSVQQFALNSHGSTGLVLLLLYAGLLVRNGISVVAMLISIVNPFQSTLGPLVRCARDFLAVKIPLSFYLWDINTDNTKLTTKLVGCFYVYLVFGMYLLISATLTSGRDLALTIASSSAWIAIISLFVLTLATASPLFQLGCSYFKYDILYHRMSGLRLHRIAAYNCICFSVIHVATHALLWADDPYYTVNNKQVLLYSPYSVSFITGIGILFCFLFASISAALNKPFKWHLYSIGVALVCIFFHGYEHIFGPAYGDNVIMFTVILCGILHLILHVSNSTMTVALVSDQCTIHQMQGETLLFLVVAPPHLPSVHPGSNYTIYGSSKHFLRFGGYTTSLFASNIHLLAFMLYCKAPVPSSMTKILHKVLSSQQTDKQVKLSLVGSVHGPGSLMLEFIHTTKPKVLFLCAENLAYGCIVALIAHIKENQVQRRDTRVYVFYDCGEQIRTLMHNELAKFMGLDPAEYQPQSQRNLGYFPKPPNDPRNIIQFARSYIGEIPPEVRKVVFYCGPEENGKLLDEFDSTWHKFYDKFPQ